MPFAVSTRMRAMQNAASLKERGNQHLAHMEFRYMNEIALGQRPGVHVVRIIRHRERPRAPKRRAVQPRVRVDAHAFTMEVRDVHRPMAGA